MVSGRRELARRGRLYGCAHSLVRTSTRREGQRATMMWLLADLRRPFSSVTLLTSSNTVERSRYNSSIARSHGLGSRRSGCAAPCLAITTRIPTVTTDAPATRSSLVHPTSPFHLEQSLLLPLCSPSVPIPLAVARCCCCCCLLVLLLVVLVAT